MTKEPPTTDIGDYLKVFSCTAVMLQPLITIVLRGSEITSTTILLATIFSFVKFTAPAFIFGIIYTVIRNNESCTLQDYPRFMKDSWHNLFIPTILWILVYLIIMPQVQQVNHYHGMVSFAWQFINGNAAPHLWYSVMMLQFIVLMPFFWWLARYINRNSRRALSIGIGALCFHMLWLLGYHILYNPENYLLDRIFISFFIYGVYGVITAKFASQVEYIFTKIWWACLIVIIFILYRNYLLLEHISLPTGLQAISYYRFDMTLYAFAVIVCLATLYIYQVQRKRQRILATIHYLAGYAYKAYLSNVFWLQIIWYLVQRLELFQSYLLLKVLLCWMLIWILSFTSAIIFSKLWGKAKLEVLGIKN
ncbi:acyltransferase family protein [Ligilactobacillus equi]|nr:acyltransferase [Ligilactobacillus equi]